MSSQNYKNGISSLATKFRIAIDEAKENNEFTSDFSFRSFPYGCCGDTCYLLGMYLLEHGIDSTYVCGNYYYDNWQKGGQSHAWLLVNGLIVDITGDQFKHHKEFNYYSYSVYVGSKDSFHKIFNVTDGNLHPILNFDHSSNYRLNKLYQKIGDYLKD